MIILWGTRRYGKTLRCAGTYVTTRFVHLYWLPLVPLASELVLETHPDSGERTTPVDLCLRSVVAAYGRAWGALACVALLALAALVADGESTAPLSAVLALLALAGALTAAAYFRVGVLSPTERAQQTVYAGFAGYPVDVALLRDGLRAEALRSATSTLTRRAQTLAARGYRDATHAAHDWEPLVADPAMTDRELLRAAFTLNRLAQGAATAREERARRARLHRDLWSRVCAAEERAAREPW